MVVARSAGRVQLQFSSAEFVQDGKAVPRERPAAKLFRLPRNARYMRLIYLIHLSHADHEMALVTATEPAGLDALTREVQLHPATGCRSSRGRVCMWIPPGIAVRPEVRKTVNGVEQWLPAL